MAQQTLRAAPLPYATWGESLIDAGARGQMDAAMRLPIAVAGALMPDAHVGYGLPIGGVLAVEDAVIPYAVGVDIACRMRLTVFDAGPEALDRVKDKLCRALTAQTRFGAGAAWERKEQVSHAVLEDPAWQTTDLLRGLRALAVEQLGTSGSGNHFVEWGLLTLERDSADLGLAAGRYLALLSHSGSRAVGFKIANHYSQLAQSLHASLPPEARHLGWLGLRSEAGAEYWQAMELAGRFAAANHEVIHRRLAQALGYRPLAAVENHHNFAWKERLPAPPGFAQPEREVIVHRKGATPAGKGVLGVIPGSMTDAGYVVRGRGSAEALNSASHGAGRQMGRRQALRSITAAQRDALLREHGVTLLGGGLDESPQAYKSIESVMTAQQELVDVVARFEPRIVRMANEGGDT